MSKYFTHGRSWLLLGLLTLLVPTSQARPQHLRTAGTVAASTLDDAPTVTITSAAGASGSSTITAPIPFSVRFSKAVTDFEASDITVRGGTVTGGSLSGNGSGPYTFTVTPLGTGNVSVSLAANVVQDPSGNGNLASDVYTLAYSQPLMVAPVITTPLGGTFTTDTRPIYSGTAPVGSTVMVYVNGGSVGSIVATSGTWSLPQPTRLADGVYVVRATAQLSGLSVSAFSNPVTFVVDTTPPVATVSGPSGGATSSSPIPFAITFSESVTGFTADGLNVVGGTISSFGGSGAFYTLTVVPTSRSGKVLVSVAARAAQDAAGNSNSATTPLSISYDAPVQATSIVRLDASPTSAATVRYQVNFSDRVTGLTSSNFTLTSSGLSGASLTSVSASGNGNAYIATVNTGTGTGSLRLDLTNDTNASLPIANLPLQGETYAVATAASALRTPENPSGTVAGLTYQYYEAPGDYTQLPNFATSTPLKTGPTATLNVLSVRQRSYAYALRFTGYVAVPADGQYTFYTSSDDGSQLFIGNQLVVDNDGEHRLTERSGTIGLQAGIHAFTITYFQSGGGENLLVSYEGPNLTKQLIPDASLRQLPPAALRVPENPANTVAGLDYQYYEAADDYKQLPDFAATTPLRTGNTADFDVRRLRQRSYAYALRFTGYVTVPTNGFYTFYTGSDDGSQLFIGNQLVVNNDGEHELAEKSGIIWLQAGTHAFTLTYFQSGGTEQLRVSYEGPDIAKQLIPAASLRRVPTSTTARLLTSSSAPTPTAGSPETALTFQAAPNPFSTEVALDFRLPTAGTYTLAVYDATGRLLEQLATGQAQAGEMQHLRWAATNYSSGLYLLRLRTDAGTQQVRVVKQ